MSIATLARKSRAQRGASTRAGWTLATTKSGNCPGPCGGGAPAKQHSFRRLMKNKARPGVEMPSGPCCFRTQRVYGNWSIDEYILSLLVGKIFIQSSTGAQGTLIGYDWEGNDHYGHGIFQMVDCQSQFYPNGGPLYQVQTIANLDTISVDPPNDTFSDCACCPPVATWKKTNDPKGEQSIGYYLWRKKQMTHNCIRHCIPHREHYAYGTDLAPCGHDVSCDNVGCKCNCNKSMGGTTCCVVHKTMLPLSNSENIAWVVEDRTCLQIEKPNPRNPNIC